MSQPRALVLSPFATVPDDAGQRRRVRQTTALLKEMGFAITFVLYAFEEGWMTAANEAHLEAMRREWGEVVVLRANAKVGAAAAFGPYHWLDEWWGEHIENVLKEMFRFRYFDVFVVHNVWLSKALEFSPRSTVRILDAHDVFSVRRPYFEKLGIRPEFYLPQENAERDGANRSDFVLGIQDEDAAWFAQRSEAESISLPYCRSAPSPRTGAIEYLHKDKVVFGFLGSSHIFNVHGLTAFCRELKDLVGRTAAPVELRIAGKVGEYIETPGPWQIEGYVKDEAAFLAGLDIVVVPVFDGSGFKVKVADALAHGKPMIMSSHAAIGLKIDESVIAETPLELARMAVQIALNRPDLKDFRDQSIKSHAELANRCASAARRLLRRIKAKTAERTVVYDLSSLSSREAHCVLLSWLGAFHVLRSSVRQLVIVPEEIEPELSALSLPGVAFLPENSLDRPISQMRQWITVANAKPKDLGVDPQCVHVDRIWAAALGYAASGSRGLQSGIFWHSVNWDFSSQRIVNQAFKCIPLPERLNPTVLLFDRRQSPGLGAKLIDLYGTDFSVLDVESFADFYQLLMHIGSDSAKLKRLVVFTFTNPERLMILQEFCAARGIEYFGPLGRGGLTRGRSPEELVKVHYGRFEQRWRDELGSRAGERAVMALS